MSTYKIFKQAYDLWKQGDNKAAFSLFLKAARLGDHNAQHMVGYFYDEGEGVEKNIRKSLYWYKKSWRIGHQTSTCSNIAKLYLEAGKNNRALYWYKKAANLGDGDVRLELAKYYLKAGRIDTVNKAFFLLKSVKKSTHVTVSAIEEAAVLLKENKKC